MSTIKLPKNFTTRKIYNKLLKYCNLITCDDVQKGVNWYKDANSFAVKLSQKYGYSVEQVAQTISILSPQTDWETNKNNAEKALQVHSNGIFVSMLKIYATKAQKERVQALLDGGYTIPPTAQKTYAFYRNIMLDDSYVTIDRHAIKAAFGITQGGSVSISKNYYNMATEAYNKVANTMSLTGYELQAVLWVTYKRVNNR